jgi:putative transposase
LSRFVKRSHSAIRDWIQKYKPKRLFFRKTKINEFVVDETQIKVGSELIWLWIEIDTQTKNIIATRAYQKSKTWL